MFSSSLETRGRRRGIVLVLVLGMLGLLALIGVTFATFAGQSLINGRNFSQGVARPQPEAMMDFALGQLINDTNNPLSALRGHSLLRDMYGNDSLFRGQNPGANPAAETAGVLSVVYNGSPPTLTTMHLTGVSSHSTTAATPFFNQRQYSTNIPTTGQYYGLDFTRWILRFGGAPNPITNTNTGVTIEVPQTFEVLEDDATGGFHVFTLSNNLVNPTNDPTYNLGPNVNTANPPPLSASDWTAFIYADPNLGATVTTSAGSTAYGKNWTQLAREQNTNLANSTQGTLAGNAVSNPFILDGRYMRAFNGPGLTRFQSGTTYPFNLAAFANFRLNGLDPDAIGMDEDYDACDLENWFLAIQSADGQVMIPSFHRPSILSATDWTASPGAGNSKILRPRQADQSPLFPNDPSTLDANGKLTYDVDNDGDGVTDSVWLDLGYPVQRDPNGKLYKPLFAFMVLGLNGRMPLNSAGNLQSRAIGDQTNKAAGLTYASTGQIPQPGFYPYDSMAAPAFHPLYSSETYLDAPTWDHASHRGFSVNEINPKFALQNAPSNVYPSGTISTNANGGYYGQALTTNYTQYDNANVSVALTQLRNLLAGTVPTEIPNGFMYATAPAVYQTNQDSNIVLVDGKIQVLPNNMADAFDGKGATVPTNVSRLNPPVPGRWGEPHGIPKLLDAAGNGVFGGLVRTPLFYNNPVRAGNSVYSAYNNPMSVNVFGTNDLEDDDLDSTDPYLATSNQVGYGSPADFTLVQNPAAVAAVAQAQQPYTIPLNPPGSAVVTPHGFGYNTLTGRSLPEFVNSIDPAGQFLNATERIRRYTTPIDPAGVGRLMNFMARPTSVNDYGLGTDKWGRTAYYRHFRPAGMPQEVRYPYPYTDATYSYPYAYTTGSGTSHRFLMPVLLPAGYAIAAGPGLRADTHTNRYHGFQSMLTPKTAPGTPAITADIIASMGAMPFDWDPKGSATGGGGSPAGYASSIDLMAPMINPYVPLAAPPAMDSALTANLNSPLYTSVSTENGPNLGKVGDTAASGTYPIPYAQYDATNYYTFMAPVVNGYLGGSLNKDEADEMNLYTSNRADMPYSASDLEWLYRKQDVNGATLSSRLSKLAPISFLNPADGQTRRRLFSTDVWDLNTFSYANDNPIPYAGAAYSGTIGSSSTVYSYTVDHDFSYNSRFAVNASPSLEIMNQVPLTIYNNSSNPADPFYQFANFITTEFLPNPTFPAQGNDSTIPAGSVTLYGNTITNLIPNSSYLSGTGLPPMPRQLDPSQTSNLPTTLFSTNSFTNAQAITNLPVPLIFASGGQSGGTPAVPLSMAQVQTPPVAHRDRKINLNFPLPVSDDPAEPVRQKWCRETYQLLKAILPPSSIDTPEELAALSQFVVNIIDFRDTDCALTRFVNTDLLVTDVLTRSATPSKSATVDSIWTVSPSGVKFADRQIPAGKFPFDPSIYNPDAVTPFLVQHGMEYSPIAINEALAYQGPGSASSTYLGMFVELVNTLTADQNGSASNVTIGGWDLVITPDAYGWGRPDSITGDVNPMAFPPLSTKGGDSDLVPPVINGAGSQRPYADPAYGDPKTTDSNLLAIQNLVQQFSFAGAGANRLPAMTGPTPTYYVVGDYRTGTTFPQTSIAGAGFANETTPFVTTFAANSNTSKIPPSFNLPIPTGGKAQYYWVYLRRPANPFQDQQATQLHPNREMVVVDSMRFPVIDGSVAGNQVFSSQRLQPFRGGHLVPYATTPGSLTTLPTAGPASGFKFICPPSPISAFGYSEQTIAPTASGAGANKFNFGTKAIINTSLKSAGSTVDTNWSTPTFHDRDFASVAELLLVPGCPPGLFTKQFIEEQYPGNIFSVASPGVASTMNPGQTPAAKGMDDGNFSTAVTMPNTTNDVSLGGRKDFSPLTTPTLPAAPTFPYLPDNFYYTAASVAPPSTAVDKNYTHLTTEIGGWTGAGWHKMLEFFEVPSSANGAVGNAANGNNYDWYRADIKPGQINLNLIIDEEVFAGLIDDPRLNEALAANSSTIPYVVSQIDINGYPANIPTTGAVFGRSPIFNQLTTNIGLNGATSNANVGRGYVYRDSDIRHYNTSDANYPAYQQVHGIKAAFSDFLKLRHGGSGYLFAFGAGPTGSGDFVAVTQVAPPGNAPLTQPVAAERPFRSLSYPDINYTILRPASLPPSLYDDPSTTYASDPLGNHVVLPGTQPPLRLELAPTQTTFGLFQYQADPNTTPVFPYVQLNPALAPMHLSPPGGLKDASGADYQYIQDPGIKNPYLAIQYVNQTSPNNLPAAAAGAAPTRLLGPPYATQGAPGPQPPAAPFPPTIPPTPTRRLLQIPDVPGASTFTSNASLSGQYDTSTTFYMVNQLTTTRMLSSLPFADNAAGPPTVPPSLVNQQRPIFGPDNFTPQDPTVSATAAPYSAANNFYGAGPFFVTTPGNNDNRQTPAFRTEWLQKISNLTTVRTHQFATWITVGFFEVVKAGTPELHIPDTLGQEMGVAKGNSVRYRSFFVIDRTKATGFNPYYPGNFRDCVTYRRRIE